MILVLSPIISGIIVFFCKNLFKDSSLSYSIIASTISPLLYITIIFDKYLLFIIFSNLVSSTFDNLSLSIYK